MFVISAKFEVIRSVGNQGRARGQLSSPHTFVRDNSGNLIVCDTGNDRIQIIDGHGHQLKTIGADGSDSGLSLSAPESLALSVDGEVLAIADTNNNRW